MAGGWGGGSSKKKDTQPAPRDPAKELLRGLGRALAGKVPDERERVSQINEALRGLTPRQVRQAARSAELPRDQTRVLVSRARAARADADVPLPAVRSAFNWTLEQASRPVQGNLSALAELSRQGEKNPINLGPLSIRFVPTDTPAILKAGLEGVALKRHESPTSISEQAGRIRSRQGESTRLAGFVPGTDLKAGETIPYAGTPGKIVYDVAASAMVDPLTYLTFGQGAAAKQGLAAATRVLGAERAAQIAEQGLGVLSAEEKARLGRDVLVRLRNVRGGVGVRLPQPIRAARTGENMLAPSRTVLPNPLVRPVRGLSRAMRESRAGRAALSPKDMVERMFVTRAGVRQAERAGRLAPGTADQLDRMRVSYKAGSDASEDLRRIAHIKRVHKLDDVETAALLDALETDPGRLSPKVRAAYDDLNEYRVELGQAKRDAGVLSSPEEVRAKRVAGLRGQYQPKFDRAARQLARVQQRVARQQANLDEALARLAAAKNEAEFVGVPAVAGRAAGVGDDRTALERLMGHEPGSAFEARPASEYHSGPYVMDETQFAGRRAAFVEGWYAEGESGLPIGMEALRDADASGTTLVMEPVFQAPKGTAPEVVARKQAQLERVYARAGFEPRDVVLRRTDANPHGASPTVTHRLWVREPRKLDAGQVPHFTGQDIAQTKAVGKAEAKLAAEKAKLRVVQNLEKSAQGRINTLATRADRSLANLPGDLPDEQYVPHIPAHGSTRDVKAEKRAAIMGGGQPDVSAGDPGFARRRTIRETIPDANAAGQEFETDPFLAFAKHAPEARRAIATRQFVDDALKMVDTDGVPLLKPVEAVGDMTDEALAEAGLTKVSIPRVGEFVVDDALKPEITKVARLAADDKTTAAVLRGIDKWMTLWKGYATVPLPFGVGFHMRNGTSNVMLNWLADINPIDPAYMQAWRIQRGISKGMKEGDALKYLVGTPYEDVARAALDRDVIGGAFFIEDLPPDLMRDFKTRGARAREAVNPLDPGNLLIRGGRRVGIEIEENARLAHFIAKYREFKNFDDAAASVRKYLFDYGDLTPFEQDWMKRLIPFYTFTRKNTPLWIAAAFKQPGKYSRIQEWRAAFIDAAGGMPEGPIPRYLEEQGAVPVPGVKAQGNPVMLAPDMPPIAASDVVTPWTQLAALVPGAEKLGLERNPEGAMAALRPLFSQTGGGVPGGIKALYDIMLGRDSFTGRPFYDGERVEAPVWLNPLPTLGIPVDNPLIPKREVDGQMVPAIDRRTQYLLEALLPMTTKLRSLLPTSPQDKDKQLRRALSILTGVQAYPLGEATQRSELFRRVEVLRRYLAGLAARGYDVPDAPPRQSSSAGAGGW